jgi:hypothetical protein
MTLKYLVLDAWFNLPVWQKRKFDVKVDERFGKELFGHPVIIAHNHKDGFANIALVSVFYSPDILQCTTFGGSTSRDDFSLKPEKKIRYIEIDSDLGTRVRGKELKAGRPWKDELLKFENLHEFYRIHRRTYVEPKTYTVKLRALTRLEPFLACRAVLGGYLKIEKPEILWEQMEKLGEDFKVQNPTVIIAEEQKKVEEKVSNTKEVALTERKGVEAPERQDTESASGWVRCSVQ